MDIYIYILRYTNRDSIESINTDFDAAVLVTMVGAVLLSFEDNSLLH